jgi:ring-1,2-phenylacetyl-CoA epoxidase subunit PaaD
MVNASATRPPQPTIARHRPPVRLTGPGAQHIAEIAGAVPDPELPMVSLANLGVLRAVDVEADPATGTEKITVTITPTYIGCPAMSTMAEDIVTRLADAGYADVTVHKVLGGDWSSDDLTTEGRQALRDAGIAPPAASAAAPNAAAIACPQCGSTDTEQLSPFGATSCKALFRCLACREPFEYFKVH